MSVKSFFVSLAVFVDVGLRSVSKFMYACWFKQRWEFVLPFLFGCGCDGFSLKIFILLAFGFCGWKGFPQGYIFDIFLGVYLQESDDDTTDDGFRKPPNSRRLRTRQTGAATHGAVPQQCSVRSHHGHHGQR